MYSDRRESLYSVQLKVSYYTVYSDRWVIIQCTVIGELLYSVQ